MPTTRTPHSEAANAALARALQLAERIQGPPPQELIKRSREIVSILTTLNADDDALTVGALLPYVSNGGNALQQTARALPGHQAKLLRNLGNMATIDDIDLGDFQERRPASGTESLRKMLLAMVADGRSVIIKLADHLQQLRAVKKAPEAERLALANRSRRIYAPLANRLGIWQLKWELEDLAFRYLHPKVYKEIATSLHESRITRESYIAAVKQELETVLREHGIQAEVSGRPKHIYSIWRKMYTKQLRFEDVYDVRAFRIVVEDVATCYSALGVVHTRWAPIPQEFDDYIANPKENSYRSLHTAVRGPKNLTLEVQIRSRKMHAHAELGVASHWRYKEGNDYDAAFEQRLQWLRRLLEQKDASEDDLLDQVTDEVLSDRVYAFTPKGDVIDLPKGGTALDFAYQVHTDIGHRCRGVKINGQIAPLNQAIENGRQVEVLTTGEGSPSRDWLNPELGYLKTARARAKVRHWFMAQNRDENIAAGRDLLHRELRRLGSEELAWDKLANAHRFTKLDDFLKALGRGDISTQQIAASVQELSGGQLTGKSASITVPRRRTGIVRTEARKNAVRIQGVGGLLHQMARCCKPIPGDRITGYITRGRGVTVHRADCKNLLRLTGIEPTRILEVSWGEDRQTYPVNIEVLAYDRPGLLRDISQILANEGINVRGVNSHTDPNKQIATFILAIETIGLRELSGIMNRLEQIPNIHRAQRKA